ncbi:MAG TPA: asparagine--tRNA ligase [Thermoplasmata archaeon]|jgi:asparaginyl-tRNA synthetase|nr:asparagine--tRNA ligase [Thermoplasmata archaeon]
MAGIPVAPAPPVDKVASVFAEGSDGRALRLRGWVEKTRHSGGLLFLLIRDRTGSVQVTAKRDVLGAESFERATTLQVEGAVDLKGTVHADPRAPGGRELRATSVHVVDAGQPFPIFRDQTEEFRLDKRHLVIRSHELVATFRVKAELLAAFRRFLDAEEVLETTPPVLTGNPAEGGAEAFQFDYFGRKGYLSQSVQLYLEALIVPNERVYALTPSFRAEKSRTPRHLTEYLHLEVELAWCDLDELVGFIERMIATSVADVANRCAKELKELGRAPDELAGIRAPFPRITYAEALQRLGKKGFDLVWGSDLRTAEEAALTMEERAPIFVTHFPRELKAFYMLQSPNDPRTVEAADLLAPEGYGEIVGASCRETAVEKLIERLTAMGADPAEYDWYLDLRRHGSVPHAGFGLGVERVLRWMLRREHIRETTPFPRTPSRHTP